MNKTKRDGWIYLVKYKDLRGYDPLSLNRE